MGVRKYVRHGTYGYKEALNLINSHSVDLPTHAEVNGVEVKLRSLRYPVFENNPTCVCCGLTGSFFAVERDENSTRYHLNLYAINSAGEEVLMTKDHILPRSHGGTDNLYNLQTMCVNCNQSKRSEIPKDIKEHYHKYSTVGVYIEQLSNIATVRNAADMVNYNYNNDKKVVVDVLPFNNEVSVHVLQLKVEEVNGIKCILGLPVYKINNKVKNEGAKVAMRKLKITRKEVRMAQKAAEDDQN